MTQEQGLTALRWGWILLVLVLCGWALPPLIAFGHWVLVVMMATIAGLTLFCFSRPGRFWPMVYPALLAITLTVLIPIGHTAWLSTTNFSNHNRLSFDKARAYLLKQQYRIGDRYTLKLATTATGDTIAKIWLTPELADGKPSPVDDNRPADFHSLPIQLLNGRQINDQQLQPEDLPYRDAPLALQAGDGPAATLQPRRNLFQFRHHLSELRMSFTTESATRYLTTDLSMGIGTYTETAARYQSADSYAPGAILDAQSHHYLLPNWQTGFYQAVDQQGNVVGKPIAPGFSVTVGFGNYLRLFAAPGIATPLTQIALWSLCYALATTLLAALLATINAWAIRTSQRPNLWQGLLVVPAAVPAEVLVLTFKGLFNQNIGELNLALEQLFATSPDWFTTSWLAQLMLIITALWLLVPLLTLWWLRLSEGFTAARWWPLVKALWPQTKAPLLMIFSVQFFAFTAIKISTNGGPDIIGATVPAGTTDTLTSLSYRIAFEGWGGQDYGLASALALLLILLAIALGWWRQRLVETYAQLGPRPQTTPITRQSIAAKPLGLYSRWRQRLWLIVVSSIALVPILALLYISLRQGNFAYFDHDHQFHGGGLTFDHWRLTLGMTITNSDGSFTPPPFAVLKWVGNSLIVAASTALLLLAIALPTACALAANAAGQKLCSRLTALQLVMPSLLLVSLYTILDSLGQYWPRIGLNTHIGLVFANLGYLLLVIPPLVAAMAAQPSARLWPLNNTIWRPVAAVALLTLILQLGEYPLSSLLLSDSAKYTAAVGMQQYLYPANTLWSDFAATALLLSLPMVLLFYLLIPLVNRDLINHWRPL